MMMSLRERAAAPSTLSASLVQKDARWTVKRGAIVGGRRTKLLSRRAVTAARGEVMQWHAVVMVSDLMELGWFKLASFFPLLFLLDFGEIGAFRYSYVTTRVEMKKSMN